MQIRITNLDDELSCRMWLSRHRTEEPLGLVLDIFVTIEILFSFMNFFLKKCFNESWGKDKIWMALKSLILADFDYSTTMIS